MQLFLASDVNDLDNEFVLGQQSYIGLLAMIDELDLQNN
jgi:hypothetical protein